MCKFLWPIPEDFNIACVYARECSRAVDNEFFKVLLRNTELDVRLRKEGENRSNHLK